jgi:hypothetical protein
MTDTTGPIAYFQESRGVSINVAYLKRLEKRSEWPKIPPVLRNIRTGIDRMLTYLESAGVEHA